MEGLDDCHRSNSSFSLLTIVVSDMQLAYKFVDTEEFQRL
jgi:hypothetical protein